MNVMNHQQAEREDVRLLTLTGPGGVGKTRLGLQVAAELSDRFADGVFFVNLAPVRDPALVVPTIAQTLDIREVTGQPLLEHVKQELQHKHMFLLLDNFKSLLQQTEQEGQEPRLLMLETIREYGLEQMNKELGDTTSLADSLFNLARLCYLSRGDLTQAHTWFEESLALYQELGDKESIAYYLQLSGLLALGEGETALAHSRVEQAVALFKEMRHRYGTTVSLYALAQVVGASGDDARCQSLYEEGIALARKEGNRHMVAFGLEARSERSDRPQA